MSKENHLGISVKVITNNAYILILKNQSDTMKVIFNFYKNKKQDY